MTRGSTTNSAQVINTTFGDLVLAITEVAMKAGQSEAEGYQLASMTVEQILGESRNSAQVSPRIRQVIKSISENSSSVGN